MSTSQPYYRKVVHPSEAGKCSSTSSFRLKVCCRRAPRLRLHASVSGIRKGRLHPPSVGRWQSHGFPHEASNGPRLCPVPPPHPYTSGPPFHRHPTPSPSLSQLPRSPFPTH